MTYLKNTAGQFLYFAMIAKADGSAITSGTVNGYRSIDGGAQAAVTGTISHKGNGQWELALSQADTNGDEIGFFFTHSSGIPVSISIVTDSKKVGSLNDLSAAAVNAEVDTALADYDPPTKAELDAGLAGLNDLDGTAVQSAAAAALTAYDPPTKAEMDAGLSGLNDLDATAVQSAAAAALTAYDPPTKAELDAGLAALNDLDATAVQTAAQTAAAAALTAYDPPTKAELDAGLAGLNDPTAAVIADAVWDEAIGGHSTGGTTGGTLLSNYTVTQVNASTLAGLNDLDATEVQTAAAAALTAYDPPTKAELDAGLAALNDLDATAVQTAAQTAAAAALTAYDPPTKAELDAGLAGLNDPTAAVIADAVWDEALAGHLTAGSTGAALDNAGAAGSPPTAAAIADAVWDELLAGHAGAGSAGAGLTAAGSAGDPWATTLPGAYGAGTAGKILGDNLDAAVSTLSTFDPATDTVDVGKISGDAAAADNLESMLDGTGGGTLSLGKLAVVSTDADAAVKIENSVGNGLAIQASAATKAALDLEGGNAGLYARGTQPSSMGAFFTGNGSPVNGIYAALVGNVAGSVGSVTGLNTATIADAVWDELLASHAISGSAGAGLTAAGSGGDPWATAVPGAYAAGTAGYLIGTYLDAAISSRSDFDAGADQVDVGAIATAVAQAIADEVLKRGVANVEDTANAASLAAIILATLESSISGSTWTIRKTAGGTFATKTVTTDAGAEPIVGVD